MAHRPIAIDGGGADGSAEVAGGVEPRPSNDRGGDGACVDRLVVPTASPRPSARIKYVVGHRVVNERRLPNPPNPSTGVGNTMVYPNGGASPCFT